MAKQKSFSKRIINVIIITVAIVTAISLGLFYIKRYKDTKIRNKLLEDFNNKTSQKNEIDVNEISAPATDVLNEEITTPTEEELKQNKDSIDNYETIGVLSIPSLKIKYPIISETSNAALKISVTKYWGPNPNEEGNMVILGHNYKTSYMLSKLPNIQIGDTIEITDSNGETLSYEVYETNTIDPYNTDCTSQKTNGNKEVTVITCIDSGKNRFYAKARAK